MKTSSPAVVPSWAELVTPAPEAAVHFYSELLGWRFEAPGVQDGPSYRLALSDAVPVAGLTSSGPAGAPAAGAGWTCYFTVPDVDDAQARCKALGGAVLLEAVPIPTVGRMAVLRDPQGAVFAVIRYDDAATT